jgi:hypothetical protein
MEEKVLRQILCLLGAVAAAADMSVKRIPIASIKLSQRSLTGWRLILGRDQNDAPVRRAKLRRVSVDRTVFRVHSNLRAAIPNSGRKA